MAKIRTFTKRLILMANIAVVVLFLLSCCNQFLRPDKWWFISLLGLFFPILLAFTLGFLIFWLFFYSRKLALLSFIALILGWTNIHSFIAFHPHGIWKDKPASGIRVMTWNVRSWDEFITKKPGASGHRAGMFQFIKEQQPDIICLQEFVESLKPSELKPNIAYIQNNLGYPYFYFSHDYRRYNGLYETGVAIFSRFPITKSYQIKYDNTLTRETESLIATDLDMNGKTIRVFTTHLQSVLFQRKDFRDVEIIRNVDDSVVAASKSIVKKLKRAYGLRGYQADLVRQEADKSPYPVVICGDFNDTPSSYTYFRILGDRQDAFIRGGLGIGRTYVNLSPTLRIDYIMTGNQFKVLQCNKFSLPFSDHHPVIADLQWNQ